MAILTKNDELREMLAELAHEQWSGWMKYMIGRLEGPDPKVWLDRWRRQMETSYANLSEEEKESDRREADRVLEIIRKWEKI